MFWMITSSIIRSTHKLWLQQLALVEPYLLPSAVMEELELRSDSSMTADSRKYGLTSARCCNYSLRVLLMMGEGIIQNT